MRRRVIYKYILLIFCFLSSCVTPNNNIKNVTFKVSDSFKQIWNPALDNSSLDDPNNQKHIYVEDSSIIFQGHILEGDCSRVRTVFEKNKIDSFVVNSQGGLVSEGICIAKLFKEYNLPKVTVNGVCWSSCANYIFLAPEIKEIRRGTVGFHGNATAIMNNFDVVPILQKYKDRKRLLSAEVKKIRKYLESGKTNTGRLDSAELKLLDKALKTYQDELEFFKERKISQDFFDKTQRKDKGESNGKTYLFLLPTKTYFLRELGLQISGDQDIEFVTNANNKFPVPLLLKQ